MFKEIIWKTFENTGSIDAYMLFKEIEGKAPVKSEELIIGEEVALSN